jgi:hypothetical protein
MPYRKATCLELHDSRSYLYSKDWYYTDSWLPGRSEYSIRPVASVNVGDIVAVANLIKDGFVNNSQKPVIETSGGILGGKGRSDSIHLPIYMEYDSDDSMNKTDLLEVEIVAANLINIRVTINATEENPEHVYEMSCSGSFTVWWDEPTPQA